jgi:hypothetical protein
MNKVIAATSPSIVQLLATANSERTMRFCGAAVATISSINTNENIRYAWNLSVTILAGNPATLV